MAFARQWIPIAAVLELCVKGVLACIHALIDLPAHREFGPIDDPMPMWAGLHFIFAAVFAGIVIPLQLATIFHHRYPLAHRILGRAGIAVGVLSAVGALLIPLAVTAFRPLEWQLYVVLHFVSNVLFLGRGYLAARSRDYTRHRRAMVGAIASALIVMTMREILPTIMHLFHPSSAREVFNNFVIASFASWVVNFTVAEWWLRAQADDRRARLLEWKRLMPLEGRSSMGVYRRPA